MIKLTCSIFISSNNFFHNFFTYVKIHKSKNSSDEYYQIIKKDYKNKLAKDIKLFIRKKKKKKQQYGHERYKNLPKEEKRKLVEYSKKYYQMRKNGRL